MVSRIWLAYRSQPSHELLVLFEPRQLVRRQRALEIVVHERDDLSAGQLLSAVTHRDGP
jgi:hypothetical protein